MSIKYYTAQEYNVTQQDNCINEYKYYTAQNIILKFSWFVI